MASKVLSMGQGLYESNKGKVPQTYMNIAFFYHSESSLDTWNLDWSISGFFQNRLAFCWIFFFSCLKTHYQFSHKNDLTYGGKFSRFSSLGLLVLNETPWRWNEINMKMKWWRCILPEEIFQWDWIGRGKIWSINLLASIVIYFGHWMLL